MNVDLLARTLSEREIENDVYNLATGYTGKDIRHSLCKLFEGIAEKTLEKEISNDAIIFQYGPATGSNEWKMEMAKYLSRSYANTVLKDNLVLTCGAHHGLHLIISTLLDLNGVIFIDELTYSLSLGICRQFSSMEVIPVAFDLNNGVDLADLRCKVRSKRFNVCKGKLFWGMYLTMSVFHNPTGVTFSSDLCETLVELAREEDFLIACDDAYNLLDYNLVNEPRKRLFAYDEKQNNLGNVVSIGTFSKIIGAGIRLGWLECPQRIVKIFDDSSILYATGASNHFTSLLITTLLREERYHVHYGEIVHKYKERLIYVYNYLKKHLPAEIKVKYPGGGCFLWIEFPPKFPGGSFKKHLVQKNIYVLKGSDFCVNTKKYHNCFRLICTYHDLPTLKIASELFCNSYIQFSHQLSVSTNAMEQSAKYF